MKDNCTKPHCDCVAKAEEKARGPVKSYPCLADNSDLVKVLISDKRQATEKTEKQKSVDPMQLLNDAKKLVNDLWSRQSIPDEVAQRELLDRVALVTKELEQAQARESLTDAVALLKKHLPAFGDWYSNYKNIDPPKCFETLVSEYINECGFNPSGAAETEDWEDRCHYAEDALKALVNMKQWKDRSGKDLIYTRQMPLAWEQANNHLAVYHEEYERSKPSALLNEKYPLTQEKWEMQQAAPPAAGPLWPTLTSEKVKIWNDRRDWDYKIIRTKDRKFIINQHDVIEIEEENFRMVDGSAIFFKNCEWLDESGPAPTGLRLRQIKFAFYAACNMMNYKLGKHALPAHVIAQLIKEYMETNYPHSKL